VLNGYAIVSGGAAELDLFRHGWWVTAGIAFAGIVLALALLRPGRIAK
jgi:hypothetical protein